VKVKIYKNIILPVVLYGCEAWTLTLMKKHRLRVFENRKLRRIFGPRRVKIRKNGGSCTNVILNLYPSQGLLGRSNQGE
jgi:hypothetical protein